MKRHAFGWSLTVAAFVCSFAARADDFGKPLAGLTAAQQAAFDRGKVVFTKVDDAKADGLGPTMNEASCVACHMGPAGTAAAGAVGGSTGRLETRFGRLTNGVFDPLASKGGSLLQDHAIGPGRDYLPNLAGGTSATVSPYCQTVVYAPEVIPPEANVVASRRTTPLFGLGLVDAVPESELYLVALTQWLFAPEQAGTVSIVTDPDTGNAAVGRFGWKAQVPTLHAFSGDAYLNEMGVTNPSFPHESCPGGDCLVADGHPLSCNPYPNLNDTGGDVTAFTDFMSTLAPPPRGTITAAAVRGEPVFAAIGCAVCHTPTLTAGSSPLSAIDGQPFHPYSDFLLHDMGALGDGITQNQATGRLMRTAPLWGVRTQRLLLHDGRATTLRAAILAHDGQGRDAVRAFRALPAAAQADLLAFLGSL